MTILVNHSPIETFNFPAGECHVKITTTNITEKTHVHACLNNSDDIIRLLLTIDAIRRINHETKIYLIIPYFPYARQDRVCNTGESLSIKVIANIINSLNCFSVTIYDPHSDVTSALLNNCKVITLSDIVEKSYLVNTIYEKNLALVSPDAGAEKKIQNLAKIISVNKKPIDIVYATKIREVSTGKIISTQIHGGIKKENFIILDDICDGGKTFIELAKLLKNLGAKNVYLYITHGIFSKGLDIFRDYFEHIYCYHTVLKPEHIDKKFLTTLCDFS